MVANSVWQILPVFLFIEKKRFSASFLQRYCSILSIGMCVNLLSCYFCKMWGHYGSRLSFAMILVGAMLLCACEQNSFAWIFVFSASKNDLFHFSERDVRMRNRHLLTHLKKGLVLSKNRIPFGKLIHRFYFSP